MKWDKEYRRKYAREYYKKNCEECKRKAREYRKRPDVAERIKEYKHQPERMEKAREAARLKRKDPKYLEKEREQDRQTRSDRKKLLNAIQLHYGCQNPNCAWNDIYLVEMLDFHHLNPSEKKGQVSMMLSAKIGRHAAEVNKCVVLCKMCHILVHEGVIKLSQSMLCNVNEELQIMLPNNLVKVVA